MNIDNLPSSHRGDTADPSRAVVTLARDHPGPHRYPSHHHFRAQLLFAASGVMAVEAADGTWVVPPQQAVWIPSGIEHEVRSEGPLAMRSLYVHPDAARRLPSTCCVLSVTPLLRELILKAVSMPEALQTQPPGRRLLTVILDELAELEPAPLHLPLPQDARVKAVSSKLIADPSDNRSLDELARTAGASARTMARLFPKETGMTFGAWRQRLRLLSAISRLGAGDPVTRVAYDLGYQSPSAFIAMFRRELGRPPGRFFRVSGVGRGKNQ